MKHREQVARRVLDSELSLAAVGSEYDITAQTVWRHLHEWCRKTNPLAYRMYKGQLPLLRHYKAEFLNAKRTETNRTEP